MNEEFEKKWQVSEDASLPPSESESVSNPTVLEQKKNNLGMLIAVVLCAILVVGAFFLHSRSEPTKSTTSESRNEQKQVATKESKSPTLSPTTQVDKTNDQNFPLTVLMEKTSVDSPKFMHTEPAPCKPEHFDPAVDTYYLFKQSGTPSELYKIKGFQEDIDSGVMMIDGWMKEGDEKISLPSPYDVTVYNFGCASSFSHVLDLKKNGKRLALYDNVFYFSFSNDKKYLYLINTEFEQGKWQEHKRIIDIAANTQKDVQNIACSMSDSGVWSEQKLITYAQSDYDPKFNTIACVWNTDAKLQSLLGLNAQWLATSTSYLSEPMGVLVSEPLVFYAVTSNQTNQCSMYMIDAMYGQKLNSVQLWKNEGPDGSCGYPVAEFNLRQTKLDGGSLLYRLQKDVIGAQQPTWGQWETVTY